MHSVYASLVCLHTDDEWADVIARGLVVLHVRTVAEREGSCGEFIGSVVELVSITVGIPGRTGVLGDRILCIGASILETYRTTSNGKIPSCRSPCPPYWRPWGYPSRSVETIGEEFSKNALLTQE
jgi:hypothetical protein